MNPSWLCGPVKNRAYQVGGSLNILDDQRLVNVVRALALLSQRRDFDIVIVTLHRFAKDRRVAGHSDHALIDKKPGACRP